MALSSSGHRSSVNSGQQVGVLRLPQGTNLLSIKTAGLVKLVILPYTVPQGAKHPVAKPGEQHYARDYYVHKDFGPSGKAQAVCPRLTFGKPCPICEAIQSQLQGGQINKDQAKKLNAKQRTLFNVWTPDDGKVLLFDTSYHTFTKTLYQIVGASVAIPGFEFADYFADAVEGSFIHATFVEKPLPSGPYRDLAAALFTRHGGVPADVLAKVVALDNLLIVESYEALKAKFWDLDADETAETATAEADHVPVVVTSAPVTTSGLVVNKPISVPVVTPAPIQTTAIPSLTAPVAPPAPVTSPATSPAASPEATAPATKKRTNTPKQTVAAEDATSAWVGKGKTVYSRAFGECTVLKNQDGVITVLDAADEPHKVKLDDLAEKPWPATSESSAPAKVSGGEAPQAASGGEENAEEWGNWEDPEENS
jgi:hypothetical protein